MKSTIVSACHYLFPPFLHIYIYIHVHTYIHTYIYIYSCTGAIAWGHWQSDDSILVIISETTNDSFCLCSGCTSQLMLHSVCMRALGFVVIFRSMLTLRHPSLNPHPYSKPFRVAATSPLHLRDAICICIYIDSLSVCALCQVRSVSQMEPGIRC